MDRKGAQRKYVDVDGIRTGYIDEGERTRPTILLVHGGFFGFWVPGGATGWSLNVPGIAENFRVVAFDKLGQGETNLPRSHGEWTFDAVVAHARGFIEKLELRNVVIVGHSRGGLLASKLALELPDVIRGLCIVSSGTLAGVQPGARDHDFYENVRLSVPSDAQAADYVSAYLNAQWVSSPIPQDLFEYLVALYDSPKHREAMETYSLVESEIWTPSLEAAKAEVRDRVFAGECTVPVAVVWGRDDRSAPLQQGFELFESIAKSSDRVGMNVLAGAGHHVFRERPAEFNELVIAHAKRCS